MSPFQGMTVGAVLTVSAISLACAESPPAAVEATPHVPATPVEQLPADVDTEADTDTPEAEPSLAEQAGILVGDASRRSLPIPVQLADGSTHTVFEGRATQAPFTFDVAAGQSILISQMGMCDAGDARTLSMDVDGPRGVNGNIFFHNGDCRDDRRYTAEASGPVTLSFREDKDGALSFVVKDVTDEAPFPIQIGQIVGPDGSEGGQGDLWFAGEEDVYTLPVTAGQVLLLNQLGCTRTGGLGNQLVAKMEGPIRGPQGFWRVDNCDDSSRYEVTDDGVAVLRVSSGSEPTMATYSFEVMDVAQGDVIELQMGSEVRAGTPVEQAGQIEQAGSRDLYSLPVTEGQTVVLTQRGGCAFEGGRSLRMDVSGAGTSRAITFTQAEGERDCFDVQRLTIEQTGTLRLLVRDVRNQVTGPYAFDVRSGAQTVEDAEEVLSELVVTPAEPETVERTITLDETLLFDFGRAELKAEALLALADVADVLGVYTDGEVRIVGHTDSVGSDESNQALSERRAEAIRVALEGLGVDAGRLAASGAGESNPVATNDTDEGRAKNRRVDITFRVIATE